MTGVEGISYVSNYLLKVRILANVSTSLFLQSVRFFHVAIFIALTSYGIKMNDSLNSSVIEESRDHIDRTKLKKV